VEAKDLIKNMLIFRESKRYTAADTLAHTWLQHQAPAAADASLDVDALDGMRRFCGQNKLKKASLQIIASRLKESDIAQLKAFFMSLDANNDGVVNFQELQDGISKFGMQDVPGQIEELMEEIDVDQSGQIDYTEFLAAALDKKYVMEERVCWAAFQVFDHDGSGTISRNELQQVLHNTQVEALMGSSAIEKVLQDVDSDSDGTIDFGEFMQMMRTPS